MRRRQHGAQRKAGRRPVLDKQVAAELLQPLPHSAQSVAGPDRGGAAAAVILDGQRQAVRRTRQRNPYLGCAALTQGVAKALLSAAQERLGLTHIRHAHLAVEVEGDAWPGQVWIERAQCLMQIHAVMLAQGRYHRAKGRRSQASKRST
jgi:hypothetical protein